MRRRDIAGLVETLIQFLVLADDGAAYASHHGWANARFENERSDFVIGSPVVALDSYEGKDLRGFVGRVKKISSTVCVEFTKNVDGHDGGLLDGVSLGRNGHCWWVPPSNIAVISSTAYDEAAEDGRIPEERLQVILAGELHDTPAGSLDELPDFSSSAAAMEIIKSYKASL